MEKAIATVDGKSVQIHHQEAHHHRTGGHNVPRIHNLLTDWEMAVTGALLWLRTERQVMERTVETYGRALRQLRAFLESNGIERPEKIHVEAYREGLTQRIQNGELSVSAANVYMIAARNLFTYLDESGIYPNECHRVKALRRRETKGSRTHKRRHVSKEHFAEMLASIDARTLKGKRDRAILLVGAGCGLRSFEMTGLRNRDLQFYADAYWLMVRGKGRTEAEPVQVPRSVLEALLDYQGAVAAAYGDPRPDEPLFVALSHRSNPKAQRRRRAARKGRGDRRPVAGMTTAALRYIVGRLLDRLPLTPGDRRKLSLHSLRHSYATWQIENGVDLRVLQRRMRHSSRLSTEVYLHNLEGDAAWQGIDADLHTLTEAMNHDAPSA